MWIAIAVLFTIHALAHLAGFLKAFGLAELVQLTTPISKPLGVAWLAATLTWLGTAATLFLAPRSFWFVGMCGIAISQILIVSSWSDAKFGTLVNVVALLPVVYGAFSQGPFGLHAQYAEQVRIGLLRVAPTPTVTEADLAALPAPVQRYLRFAGVVGQPRVRNYQMRFRGRIRSAADAPWMAFTAEQFNFTDRPTRLFMMDAQMKGLQVDVYHSYIDAEARMRVKLLSLFPMVDASGFDFTTAETVTIFNDMCVMAPATLLSPAITWETIDDKTVHGNFTNAGHTIHATLYFDDAGALVNFASNDRPALAPDGKSFVPQRWSTPLTGYRAYGATRVASHGEARYAPTSGEFTYGEFELLELAYNVAPR